MSEGPKRFELGQMFLRETNSIPQADKWLENRAEWMVGAAQIKKYLAPKIEFRDRLAGEVEKGVKVLAIGAGKGHELDEMDSILPGSEIIGLDPDDFYSRPVKQKLEKTAHNASYLPETIRAENLEGVENASLDGVTLFFVLHHIDEQKHGAVLKEIHRVLKPDGKVFIAEDLVDNDEERKITERTDRILNTELSGKNSHHYRSIPEWKVFFHTYGFEIIEVSEQKPDKVRHGFFVLEKANILQNNT